MDTRDFNLIERHMNEFRRNNPGQKEGFYKAEEMRIVQLYNSDKQAFFEETRTVEKVGAKTNKDKRREFVAQNRVEPRRDNIIPFDPKERKAQNRDIKGRKTWQDKLFSKKSLYKAIALGLVAATALGASIHYSKDNVQPEKPATSTTEVAPKVLSERDMLRECRVMIAAELNDKYKDEIDAGTKEGYEANNLKIWKDRYGLHLLREEASLGDPEHDYHNEIARCKPYLEYESVAEEKGTDVEILKEYNEAIWLALQCNPNSKDYDYICYQFSLVKEREMNRLAENGIKLTDKDFEEAMDKETIRIATDNEVELD